MKGARPTFISPGTLLAAALLLFGAAVAMLLALIGV